MKLSKSANVSRFAQPPARHRFKSSERPFSRYTSWIQIPCRAVGWPSRRQCLETRAGLLRGCFSGQRGASLSTALSIRTSSKASVSGRDLMVFKLELQAAEGCACRRGSPLSCPRGLLCCFQRWKGCFRFAPIFRECVESFSSLVVVLWRVQGV